MNICLHPVSSCRAVVVVTLPSLTGIETYKSMVSSVLLNISIIPPAFHGHIFKKICAESPF